MSASKERSAPSLFLSFKKGLGPWFKQSVVIPLGRSSDAMIAVSQSMFCAFVFVQAAHLSGIWIASGSTPIVGSYLIFPGLDFNPEYVSRGLLPALCMTGILFLLRLIVARICRVGFNVINNEFIENAVLEMVEPFSDKISSGTSPCTAAQLEVAESDFKLCYDLKMPEPYKLILGLSNGLQYKNLTLWPVSPSIYFEETLFEANSRLKSRFLKELVYFGYLGEDLFAFNAENGECCRFNKKIVQVYVDADHMFKDMLAKALS